MIITYDFSDFSFSKYSKSLEGNIVYIQNALGNYTFNIVKQPLPHLTKYVKVFFSIFFFM